MYKLKCSNCGKEIQSKKKARYTNSFCSKKCESEFRKGKLTRERKQNEIVINNDYAIIKIQNNQKGKLDCFIDIEDIEKVKNYYWNIRYDKRHPNSTMYVESHKRLNGKNVRIHLHRLITNCPDKYVVDHINGNGLDNRKNNLRVVTQKSNTLNRIFSNRTLPTGVILDGRSKNTSPYIVTFQGKYIGRFKDVESAKNKYLEVKQNYFHSLEQIVA